MTYYDKLLPSVCELGMDYRCAGMSVKKLRDDENTFPIADIEKRSGQLSVVFIPVVSNSTVLLRKIIKNYVPVF